MVVKFENGDSVRVVIAGAFLVLAALVFAGSRAAEAAPPSCMRIAESIRARDCCKSSERNCASLWASYAKRGCEPDPCLIGCGMDLCDARADEACCNESCSMCAPPDVVCPAEICF
jgi:hypothetical protein